MHKYINANDTIRENDYETITAAISLACEDGCRKVVIPRYNLRANSTVWSLIHAIQLPGDFTLILDNCYMEQAKGSYDHLIESWRAHDTEYSNKPENTVKNIKIIGEGNVCLSGGEHNHLYSMLAGKYGLCDLWWDQIMFWHNVDGLYIENIHLEHQRHWAIFHVFCTNIYYKNIDFFAYPHVPNMDGIDLRMGCSNVKIENVTGLTGDDVFAMTDYMGPRELSMEVPGMSKDIHDVEILNLKASSHNCHLIRVLNHDGYKAYNILFDTVMDSSDPNSFLPVAAVTIGSPSYFKKSPALPGDTYGITIKNVYSCAEEIFRINHVCQETYVSNVHSFGNNSVFFNTLPDGLKISSFIMENLYAYSKNPDYVFLKLMNTDGDVSMNHVEIDKAIIGFQASGPIKVKVNNLKTGNIENLNRLSDGAEIVSEDKG